MEMNERPNTLDEAITQLIDELETKFRATEDKDDKFVLSAKYNAVKYLYQLFNNTHKAINELKNQNDL
jgi:hypothetical protein